MSLTNHRTIFWFLIALLTAIWVASTPDVFELNSFFPLRSAMTQLSGFLATSCMGLSMILSIRPHWPEVLMGGLDKMYSLHRLLGIGALVLAATHWIWTQAPKWAVALELIAPLKRPVGGDRPAVVNPFRAFLEQFRGLAEQLGELAFYVAVVLIVVALVTRIPYQWFLRLHRLFPIVWLMLVFHSLVLTSFDYWTNLVGVVLAVLMIGGTYAALVSLFCRIGKGRQVEGTILVLNNHPGVHSLEVLVKVGTDWPGHQAGQFAYVVADRQEGAHPYTIASAWNPQEPHIRFIVKQLGDYTTGLVERLNVGQHVRVEGPYGCFNFDDDCSVQVWISGGIGITPFVGRMQELANSSVKNSKQIIHLFHSTVDVDDEVIGRLQADADASGVQLQLYIEARDGFLTGEEIRSSVPGWKDASYWFCGPVKFGKVLRANLSDAGVPVATRFHQEVFG